MPEASKRRRDYRHFVEKAAICYMSKWLKLSTQGTIKAAARKGLRDQTARVLRDSRRRATGTGRASL